MEGIVARTTERPIDTLASEGAERRLRADTDGTESLEEEEPEEPAKAIQDIASFNEIIIWGHEALPEHNDMFSKSMEEWIGFAGAIHSHK